MLQRARGDKGLPCLLVPLTEAREDLCSSLPAVLAVQRLVAVNVTAEGKEGAEVRLLTTT